LRRTWCAGATSTFSPTPKLALLLLGELAHTVLMIDSATELLDRQVGVITRAQLRARGIDKPTLDRLVRRRELVRLLPGVFVNHTGTASWLQRAWAGTLYYAPAALGREAALRALHGAGWRGHDDAAPITIMVDASRHLAELPGYDLHRVVGLEAKVHWQASPPKMRVEEAVLDIAAGAISDSDALEVLADAVRSRCTTPQRLLATLAARSRIRRRKWLIGVLNDLAEGTSSVLESGYLRLVERAHGLPRSARQAPALSTLGSIHRDVDYGELGVYVELDGALFHDNPQQRDRDLDRDLDAATESRITLRLGWGQVFRRPCPTAARVAAILQTRGWTGAATPCGPECALRLRHVG
jgi:Transcriptional regulator, AbiEi antitoxin